MKLIYKSKHGDIPLELDLEMPKDWVVCASLDGSYLAMNLTTGETKQWSKAELTPPAEG